MMINSDQSRDEYFMGFALAEAVQALDLGEFPVGCVIVGGDTILASGARVNSQGAVNELDHAEVQALKQLYGRYPAIDRAQLTVYATMEPCLMCTATLIVSGIQQVVYAYEDAMGGGTNLPLGQLAPLYAKHPFTVRSGVRRRESLALFQRFFRNPQCNYLRDSYLAQYTLSQV